MDEILQQLDRAKMQAEDYRSSLLERLHTVRLTEEDLSQLLNSLTRLFIGKSRNSRISLDNHTFDISVKESLDKSLEVEHLRCKMSGLRASRVLEQYSTPIKSARPNARVKEQYTNLKELKRQVISLFSQQEHTKKYLESRYCALKKREEEIRRKESLLFQGDTRKIFDDVYESRKLVEQERMKVEKEKLELNCLKEKIKESRQRLQELKSNNQ